MLDLPEVAHRRASAGTGLGRVAAGFADGPQRIDAAFGRVQTDLEVERRALLADLAHVTQHQPARPGQRGQRLDGGAHRIGVGVVGVVDQRHRLRADAGVAAPLRTARHRAECLQAAADGIKRAAGGERAAGGRERVAHVVPAGHVQAERDAAGGRVQHQRPAVAAPLGVAADVGVALQREGQRRARAGQAAPQRRMVVVGREHGHPGRPERFDHGAVLARHRGDAVHEFLVLALRVVDERDARRGHRGQRGDLAGVVHAEFEHRGAMPADLVLAQPQQRQRHTDVVVEVARGGQRRVAQPGVQDGRDHLRDGGLAVAAGHGDQRQLDLLPPRRGQSAQRLPAVGDLQAGQARGMQAAFGQRRQGAHHAGLRQKVVRIETLAAQRDEQVAGAQAARVAVHALDAHRTVANQRGAGQQGMRPGQGHHAGMPRISSAVCASATSENGSFSPRMSW